MTLTELALQQLAIHIQMRDAETAEIFKRVLKLKISHNLRKRIIKQINKLK